MAAVAEPPVRSLFGGLFGSSSPSPSSSSSPQPSSPATSTTSTSSPDSLLVDSAPTSTTASASAPRPSQALPDPLAGDDEIQYLFIDENPFAKKKERPVGSVGPFPMRTGYDKLNYGTGMAYVLGLTAGGSYGVMRGLQIAPGKSYKIRMNSVMNTATRYGPWAANSLGILTMGWALMDNLFYTIRGKTESVNHVAAAFFTGVLFKSTAGVRPALVAGGLMAGASTAACYFLSNDSANTNLNAPAKPGKH